MKPYFVLLILLFLSSCAGQDQPPDEFLVPAAPPPTETVMLTAMPAPSATSFPTHPAPAAASPIPTSTPLPPTMPPTPTAQPPSVSFAVIGDYGTTGAGTQEVAALVRSWDPDFVITLGDNNYPDGAAATMAGNVTQHYGRFIDENRFFPVLGNHDMTTDFGQPYFDYFELPGNERYYDFVQGGVHFFALNSDWREADGIGAGSRQAAWLQEGLAASNAPWQVVYFHAPPYVSMAAKQVAALRWPFAQWGADLLLSGHAHLYERLHVEGIPYLVNGLGGGGIYPFDEQPHPASQYRFNDDYGALLLEATADTLTAQFVTHAGTIVDQLTLSRSSVSPGT